VGGRLRILLRPPPPDGQFGPAVRGWISRKPVSLMTGLFAATASWWGQRTGDKLKLIRALAPFAAVLTDAVQRSDLYGLDVAVQPSICTMAQAH
jgi:hypothetical protein